MFLLIEEVLVHLLSTKQPDVTVICDCAISEGDHVQKGTLGFSFHWGDDEWHAEQLQELLLTVMGRHREKTNDKEASNRKTYHISASQKLSSINRE